jgi:hypothetical protein
LRSRPDLTNEQALSKEEINRATSPSIDHCLKLK